MLMKLAAMSFDTPLETEIRQLIREATTLLYSGHIERHVANDLLARLYACADRAAKVGFVFSEQQLNRLAWTLEQRIKTV